MHILGGSFYKHTLGCYHVWPPFTISVLIFSSSLSCPSVFLFCTSDYSSSLIPACIFFIASYYKPLPFITSTFITYFAEMWTTSRTVLCCYPTFLLGLISRIYTVKIMVMLWIPLVWSLMCFSHASSYMHGSVRSGLKYLNNCCHDILCRHSWWILMTFEIPWLFLLCHCRRVYVVGLSNEQRNINSCKYVCWFSRIEERATEVWWVQAGQ